MNPRSLLSWTLGAALALLGLWAIDLAFVDRTLLTTYAESHPATEPSRHPTTGLLYVQDLETKQAFTLLPGGRVAYLDAATGQVDPERDATAIRIVQGKVVQLHEPLSPLYAFYLPVPAHRLPRLFPALALSALALALILRLERARDRLWLFLLPALAILVRAAFAWIRQPLGEIGSQFVVYDNEELLFDVPRVTGVFRFLDGYAEAMSGASLHGSHFPPGYILLFKAIALLAGDSNMAAIQQHVAVYGWSVLVLGATAFVPLFLLARDLVGSRGARFAAALFLFAPNSIAFGAVSLDAVFAAAALWTIWAFRRGAALVAGILLGLTTFLSFSGLVVGLFLLLLFVLSRQRLGRLAWFAAGIVLFVSVLQFAFGFDFAACFHNARLLETRLMEKAARGRGTTLAALRGYVVWANLGAFFLGSGLALVGPWLCAVVSAVRTRWRATDPRASFTLALLGVVLAGAAIFHMETERIWLYLTAGLSISVGGLLTERWLLIVSAALILQALLSEALLVTLW